MKQITLETVVDRAARRLGCRKALFTKIGISRQRVHSAVCGGPPLHVERLLRLSKPGVDDGAAGVAGIGDGQEVDAPLGQNAPG